MLSTISTSTNAECQHTECHLGECRGAGRATFAQQLEQKNVCTAEEKHNWQQLKPWHAL